MKFSTWTELVWGTFLTFCLLACSENSTAGRGIWDETENGLAVVIRGESGAPVSKAEVRLVRGTAEVYERALTDSSGTAYLNRPEFSGHLEVSSENGVARTAFLAGDSLLSDTLHAPATLTGVLHSAENAPGEFYLHGTSYRAKVYEDGKFRFEGIPSGEYAILAPAETSFVYWKNSRLRAGENVTVDLEIPSEDSVIVEDFESGRGTNLFHVLTGGGWWFTYWNSFKVLFEHPQKGHVENAWNGTRSLHEQFFADSVGENPYALVGFNIGLPPAVDSVHAYDMANADSISFYVKGEGHVFLQLAGYNAEGKSLSCEFEFDIPSEKEWNRVSVVPQGDVWDIIAGRMESINFLVKESADLWLDQIVFHGVSASELFSRELGR